MPTTRILRPHPAEHGGMAVIGRLIVSRFPQPHSTMTSPPSFVLLMMLMPSSSQ
jgi:hypothetical protein